MARSSDMARRPSLLRIHSSHLGDRVHPPSPLLTEYLALPEADSASGAFVTPPCTPPILGFSQLPLGGPGAAYFAPRPSMMRRMSSRSSISSSVGDEIEESQEPWTEEELSKLKKTYEAYVSKAASTLSPFSGQSLPSNLTHHIARAVSTQDTGRVLRSNVRSRRGSQSLDSGDESDSSVNPAPQWKHGMKSTRAKLLSLVKEQQGHLENTPTQCDPDATPKRSKAMVRQGSMDFLPVNPRNIGVVARLGSKLQASEPAPAPSYSEDSTSPRRPRLARTASLSRITVDTAEEQPRPAPVHAHSMRMQRTGSETMSSRLMGQGEYDNCGSTLSSHSADLSAWRHGVTSGGYFDQEAGSSDWEGPGRAGLDLTPKRGSGTGLAQPFGAGPYPSPLSNKKVKLNHGANSLQLGDPLVSSPSPSSPNMSPTKAARAKVSRAFYLGGGLSGRSSASSSCDSLNPPSLSPSSVFGRSLGSSSGASSSTSTLALPSPMSAAFDLNDLSLEALAAEQKKDPSGFLDISYIAAGEEAKRLRGLA